MGLVTRLVAGTAAIIGAAAAGTYAYAQYRDGDESADYEVRRASGDFELRVYSPMIVAQVTSSGTRREASERSFKRLASYIFAKDRPEGGEKIAMTSPVMQNRVDEDRKIDMTAPVIEERSEAGEWRMRFVMPARYTLATLPTPPEDIELTPVSARHVAAVRFSGWASNEDLARMEARLTAWIANEGLTPLGDFEYAFYDAPMVPGPVRRNEVLIEVAAP